MRTFAQRIHTAMAILLFATATFAQKPYRLPDLGGKFHDQVIWGSEATSPDGFTLAFGGQDQVSDDGTGNTRIREKGGEWVAIEETLTRNHGFFHSQASSRRNGVERLAELQANLRALFFENAGNEADIAKDAAKKIGLFHVALTAGNLDTGFVGDDPRFAAMLKASDDRMARFGRLADQTSEKLNRDGVSPEVLRDFSAMLVALDQAADAVSAEPPPRALSPLAFDPKTGLFVLFGGDHFDFLMNDVWVFNPKSQSWSIRVPEKSPRPRANHTLKAKGDGTIVMTGGYTYTSNTDYLGGQYIDLDDGEWVYDVAKNTWTGDGPTVPSGQRTYRTGPFHPEFYYEPKPDRTAHGKILATLPANQWTKLNPPKLPRLNRDWGTAVLDPHRDLILRYSGGHSAHGGTDVLHYHIATNRWELCYPVEFPLGQLYANTRYPNGYNFNGRPWITGHTYQNYGYDVRLKKMLYSGRREYTYIYDIDRGDWDGRFQKPEGMVYNNCFYTLTNCSTPQGLVCWTKDAELFRFDADKLKWLPLNMHGEQLPGAIVDNSTVTYDSQRQRLLFFRKPYGNDHQYDGQIHAYDLATGEVTMLSPAGMPAATEISYLCQIRYDEANDLLLVGATLPPDENGLRRTPAYDPAKNRWVSLKIIGDDPNGTKGRNVSLGMMYDASRKMFLAVDTNSQVYALKLDVAKADVRPLSSE